MVLIIEIAAGIIIGLLLAPFLFEMFPALLVVGFFLAFGTAAIWGLAYGFGFLQANRSALIDCVQCLGGLFLAFILVGNSALAIEKKFGKRASGIYFWINLVAYSGACANFGWIGFAYASILPLFLCVIFWESIKQMANDGKNRNLIDSNKQITQRKAS